VLLAAVTGVAALVAGCGERLANFSGERPLPDRELLESARRPLAAYHDRGRSPADLVDAAAAMRNRLDSAGYALAEVQPEPAAGQPPLFRIDAGPRVAIGAIRFTGDTGMGEHALAQASGLHGWFTSAGLDSARRRVALHLRAAGHLAAEVRRPLLTWTPAGDRVDIAIAVRAGPRFVLRAERLVLADDAPPSLAGVLIPLLDRPGVVVDPRLGAEAAARVRARLGQLGHLAADVQVHEHLDIASSRADIELHVSPGPVHVLHQVGISGDRRTRRSFVDRWLRDLRPDQPLSQTVLDRAESDLALTGLYRSVRVDTAPAASPPAPAGVTAAGAALSAGCAAAVGFPGSSSAPAIGIGAGVGAAGGRAADRPPPPTAIASPPPPLATDVRIGLREADTHHLDWSVGYGSYEQLRAGAEYRDDHLLGLGLRLRVGAHGSLIGYGGDIGLAEPFRFGPGRLVALDLAYDERKEPSFSHREASITPSFTQRFRAEGDQTIWDLRLAHRFEAAEDYDVGAPVPGREADTYTISKISADLSRDSRRPRRIDPDQGSLASLGVAWSGKPLGAQVEYVELRGEVGRVFLVAPWLVVAAHAGAATRHPIGADELPLGERLFLGGEDSVRSFATDDLSPRDAAGRPLGGLTRVVGNLELRWRPFANHRTIEIATFYDIGWLDLDAWTLSDQPGQAIGGGIRYRLPVGPLRVDAAWNPGNQLGADDDWAVHAAVGFAF